MNLNQVTQFLPKWVARASALYLLGAGHRQDVGDRRQRPGDVQQFGMRLGMVELNGGDMNVADTVGYLMPGDRDGVFTSEFSLPFWWFTKEGKALTEYDGATPTSSTRLRSTSRRSLAHFMWNGCCAAHAA